MKLMLCLGVFICHVRTVAADEQAVITIDYEVRSAPAWDQPTELDLSGVSNWYRALDIGDRYSIELTIDTDAPESPFSIDYLTDNGITDEIEFLTGLSFSILDANGGVQGGVDYDDISLRFYGTPDLGSGFGQSTHDVQGAGFAGLGGVILVFDTAFGDYLPIAAPTRDPISGEISTDGRPDLLSLIEHTLSTTTDEAFTAMVPNSIPFEYLVRGNKIGYNIAIVPAPTTISALGLLGIMGNRRRARPTT